MARADYLFDLNTEDSIRSAMQLEPEAWRYPMRLSQFDDAGAEHLLERSLQLNSYNAPADIELGLYAESVGDYQGAEKLMLEAFAIDHTYATRWALANFYFRRGNEAAFWTWAASAARMPTDNMGGLFDLCWRESTDPEKISNAILNDNPRLIRHYIEFLVTNNHLPAAAAAAERLVQDGDAETDTPQVMSTIDRLMAANDGTRAYGLWHAMTVRGWVKADATTVNNPKFAREPLPVSFDWNLPAYDGLHSWTGPAGLESEFTGREPEACTVAEQSVVLSPGAYSLQYFYRTSDIPPGTGLKWEILDAASDKPLAESADLSSESAKGEALVFSVPPNVSLLRIRLAYQRPVGSVRISGRLAVASVQIQPSRK